VVAVIPPRSPQAIAEALRRLDLDGGSLALVDATGDDGDESFRRRKARTFFDPRLERNPRPGRRTQWCLPWNPIRPMHLGEILRVSGELAERPREDPEAPSPTAPVKPAPPRRDVDREAEAHRRRVAEMEAFVLASLEKERAGRAAAAAKGGAPC
jgi:hypothetical protein